MKVKPVLWSCVVLLLLSRFYLEVEAHSCYGDGMSCVDQGGECDREGGVCFMLPPAFEGDGIRCCCSVTDDCAGVPKSGMMKKIEL